MKYIVFVAGVALAALSASASTKSYPLEFRVLFADRIPGDLGHIGSCSMRLRAGNSVYMVWHDDTFHPCVLFAPGTVLRGSENHGVSAYVDLLDDSAAKPKAHRYWVRDVELVRGE